MTHTAVKFYHMTVWPLEKTLPRLMEIAYQKGIKAFIHGPQDVIERLDKALWTYHPAKFLPHGTERDAYPDEQPILLSTRWSPVNHAGLLVLVDGTVYDGEIVYDRLFDLFDGTDDEAVTAARERWQTYKARGWDVSYARQNDEGGWDERTG